MYREFLLGLGTRATLTGPRPEQVLPGGHGLGRLPLRMVGSLEELDLAQYFARNNVYQIDMSVSHSAARAAGSSISSATRRRAFYTYRMAAGGAAMHHPLTPHRSSPNTSTRDRRVIILRFMASGDHDPPAYALHWAGRSNVTVKGAQPCPVHACTASR